MHTVELPTSGSDTGRVIGKSLRQKRQFEGLDDSSTDDDSGSGDVQDTTGAGDEASEDGGNTVKVSSC